MGCVRHASNRLSPSFFLPEPSFKRRPLLKSRLTSKQVMKDLITRANAARDARAYASAATLYEAALAYDDNHAGAHMQCGHMHKEARQLEDAERHYLKVVSLTPDDPEIYLQLGHFYKTGGKLDEAEANYSRASELRPDWDVPRDELHNLRKTQQWTRPELKAPAERSHGRTPEAVGSDAPPFFINPGIYPKTLDEILVEHREAMIVTRLGNPQRTRWGEADTLRDIDAIRGYFISNTPYLYVEVYIDGERVAKEPLTPGRERKERTAVPVNKYSFNIWVDVSKFSYGWHEVIIRGVNVRNESREHLDWHRRRVIIAEPIRLDAFRDSDGWIPDLEGQPGETLVEKINALPSVVHKASPRSVPVEPRNILVQRLDQLGDLTASAPALRRLRELVPEAKIVGLLGPANEGLARTLGVFDEILVVDFPDDPVQEDRIMDREGQLRLGAMLAPYKFDVAFDLSYYGTTRQLLPLSGAPMMVGFGEEEWLTLSLTLHYNEGRSRRELLRHAGKTRMLIEAFGAFLDSGARVMRRDDLSPDVLRQYGVEPGETFVVLHAGSRIKFSRWPYFSELADRILDETSIKVVVMADDSAVEARMSERHRGSDRIVFLTHKMPFEHFDAFLSYCSAFVGNDSGPKHLASLRGANVISLHCARTNWQEWGQDPSGVILSRRVPCAGCGLHHNPEECAKGVVCVTGITVDEVFREVSRSIEAGPYVERPVSGDAPAAVGRV